MLRLPLAASSVREARARAGGHRQAELSDMLRHPEFDIKDVQSTTIVQLSLKFESTLSLSEGPGRQPGVAGAATRIPAPDSGGV